MEFKKVEFKEKYLDDAATMLSETWHYEKHLKGNVDTKYFYRIFFKVCQLNTNFTEFYVNENDKLVGVLTSTGTKMRFSFSMIPILLSGSFAFIIGKFGSYKQAWRLFKKVNQTTEFLMKDKHLYDEEISLFFVSDSCRGHGLGKKIMNSYVDYCKDENVKNIILLTDAGCNYGFYEHYGFERINEMHSDFFAHPELHKNGFAYAYNVVR